MRRPAAAAAATAALVAAVAGGCLDFVEPGARPAALTVSVSVRDGNPPRARLQAVLQPPQGSAARLADPGPILFWGRTIAPATVSGRTVWDEEWTPDPARLEASEVVVHPPALPGRPDSTLRLPLVWRAGPDSVALGDDGAVFPVRVPPAGLDSARAFWNLSVQRADEDDSFGGSVRASGRGAPPDTLRLPRSLLPGGSGPLRVRLQVGAATAPEQGLESTARLTLSTEILWTLTR